MTEENTPEEHASPPLVAYARSAWRPVAVRTAERTVTGLTRRFEDMVARPADALAWPATLRGRMRRDGPARSAARAMAGHRPIPPGPPIPAVPAADGRDGQLAVSPPPDAAQAPHAAEGSADAGTTEPATTPHRSAPSSDARTVRATPAPPVVRAAPVRPAARAAPGHPLSPPVTEPVRVEATTPTVRNPDLDEKDAGTARIGARGSGADTRPPPGRTRAATHAGGTTDLLGTLFDALTAPREIPDFTVRAANVPRTGESPPAETPVPPSDGGVPGRRADRTAAGPRPAPPGEGVRPAGGTYAPAPDTHRAQGLRASELLQVADRVGEMLLRRQEIERERNGGS
jgi:hypothetical protein